MSLPRARTLPNACEDKSTGSRLRKLKPWMTTEIVEKIRKRDKLRKLLNSQPLNDSLKNEYICLRNKVGSLIKRAKYDYFKNNSSESVDMHKHENGTTNEIELLPPPITALPKDKYLDDRLKLVKDHFYTKFKAEPELYLRVPGRVNLIGEHVDYCGYSVCPMALQQDILVAFRGVDEKKPFLSVTNSDSEKYEDYSTDTEELEFSLEHTGWVSYLLCGVKAVIQLVSKSNQSPVAMQVAISGNIPPSSGLSSSSALVCAGVLASALSNKLKLSKTEMANLSAQAEHYIGTVGGGMDQAIIFLASAGSAKLIDFNPLRTRDVNLPKGAVFVVAHSLATKNKAASNDFNTRVVECRLAAQVLAKSQSLPWEKCLRLAEFQKLAGLKLNDTIKLVQEILHEAPYSKSEVCQVLGVTNEELNKLTLTPNTESIEEFKLFQRAMHVFQEAERVSKFEAGCREGCDLTNLGQLMTSSHNSLRDLYQCSHPQVDQLVTLALSAGALGARITGAGWGGCIVALITEDKINSFMTSVKQQFYADNPEAVGKPVESLMFATQPGQGVQIFNPQTDE